MNSDLIVVVVRLTCCLCKCDSLYPWGNTWACNDWVPRNLATHLTFQMQP